MRITAKSVTIEDEHGQAKLVVDAQVPERDRVPPLTLRLLVVEGRVEWEDQHAEAPIIPLIAARPIDRTCWAPCQRLAHGCAGGSNPGGWVAASEVAAEAGFQADQTQSRLGRHAPRLNGHSAPLRPSWRWHPMLESRCC